MVEKRSSVQAADPSDNSAPAVSDAQREVVVTRVFQAPRELVWKAFTESERLAKWWGPRVFHSSAEFDARVGGAYRITMHGSDGTNYPMTGVVRELVAPERLVLTQNLDDQPQAWHEALIQCGADTRGHQAVLTITFEDLGGDQTRLTLTTLFDTTALRDAFRKMGMLEGWTDSLVRLESQLDGSTGVYMSSGRV